MSNLPVLILSNLPPPHTPRSDSEESKFQHTNNDPKTYSVSLTQSNIFCILSFYHRTIGLQINCIGIPSIIIQLIKSFTFDSDIFTLNTRLSNLKKYRYLAHRTELVFGPGFTFLTSLFDITTGVKVFIDLKSQIWRGESVSFGVSTQTKYSSERYTFSDYIQFESEKYRIISSYNKKEKVYYIFNKKNDVETV